MTGSLNKKHWIYLSLLLAPFVAGCHQPRKSADGQVLASLSNSPIDQASVVFQVHGMSCPLCADNISKKLKDVEGVSRTHIDLGTGKVQVWLGGTKRPSERTLAEAIQSGGFTVVGVVPSKPDDISSGQEEGH